MTFLSFKGWEQKAGDEYFQQQRQRADTAKSWQCEIFYTMMKKLAFEMDTSTGVLSFTDNKGSKLQVLDLCMAPGGFSAAILALNPTASINGISLPRANGGHELLLPFGERDPRVCVFFTDITMLAAECGVDVEEIPEDHPDAVRLTSLRPYSDKNYDLVLCDGQVLRTHTRESYRDQCEPTRLTNAQLILALQRIKPGGTLIILLHNLNSFHSMMLIRSFCKFATVELFKPKRAHAIRSSFYMVAKDVKPHSAEAKIALEKYKSLWHNATFGHGVGVGKSAKDDGDIVDFPAVLEDFGPTLAELGRGIWTIQADALEKAPFMRNKPSPKYGNKHGR